jgi:amidophosphoribosyltransferase
MLYTGVEGSADHPRHHCGVVGIFSRTETDIPEQLFYGLFALQHRGEESAGIAYRKGEHLVAYKDLGMVSTVLSRYLHDGRRSTVGIGHVRYSTQGGTRLENAQPVVAVTNKGNVAIAHNGNISNVQSLKSRLVDEGAIFQSTSDTELMLHLVARSREQSLHDSLVQTLRSLRGAYSLVIVHDNSLIAIRDPHGFRPLYIGTKGDSTVVASETCALHMLQIPEFREVEPGELITVDAQGTRSERFAQASHPSMCVFELIYFARPDSEVFQSSVHRMRRRMGAALAAGEPNAGDVVIPVPDSGNIAALGFAEESGIPFDLGLTRNHYTGRSFILPTTAEREQAVRMKLHPVRSVIAGKRVMLVDDSLVRGTTARILVSLVREAGAKEVHLRLSAPELKWPCRFGIDIPTRSELISNRFTPEEIADHIRADSVRFLPLDVLESCVESPADFCFACFSGNYPEAAI